MSLIRDQVRLALRVDGQDHLNLSVHSKNIIGQLASPESRKRFFIPHLGEFGSPRCFANWMVSCGDEALRFSRNRYDISGTTLNVFRLYMLYAKYFQLVSVAAETQSFVTTADHPVGKAAGRAKFTQVWNEETLARFRGGELTDDVLAVNRQVQVVLAIHTQSETNLITDERHGSSLEIGGSGVGTDDTKALVRRQASEMIQSTAGSSLWFRENGYVPQRIHASRSDRC
jgi:hypothetical protein